MDQKQLADILRVHELRKTKIRLDILEYLQTHEYAISQPELEKHFGETYNRVSIYRTLSSFENNGIIHSVLDESGVQKFAVCKNHCKNEKHYDKHIHFKCRICEKTVCLYNTELPNFKLPTGFAVQEIKCLVEGICEKCSQI